MRSRGPFLRLGVPAAVRTLLLLLLLAPAAPGAQPKFPALTGRVVDEADILSPAADRELTDMLAAHERATRDQVVVVTLKSLEGNSIEDFGYQLGRYWGIGQKGKNNGVILIVAPHERKVRIEVGYGMEGKLTDAISRIIIERDILPAFRRGDFNGGVLSGTASILRVLGGDDVTGAQGVQWDTQQAPSYDPMRWLGIVLIGGWGLIFLLMHLIGPRYDPRKAYLLRRAGRSSRGVLFHGLPSSMYGGGEGAGGSAGGGSGGGGGFSGGGGSFGGGGASGSW